MPNNPWFNNHEENTITQSCDDYINPFPNDKFSTLKEFADDNFIFYENGIKFTKRVNNTGGKEEIACSSFTYSVFKRLPLLTKPGLVWERFKEVSADNRLSPAKSLLTTSCIFSSNAV